MHSFATCLVAAAVVVGVQALFPETAAAAISRLSRLGVVGLFLTTIGLVVLTGIVWPRHVLSAARGLGWTLTGRHLGIAAKVAFAAVAYLGICYAFEAYLVLPIGIWDSALLLAAVAFGTMGGWGIARLTPGVADGINNGGQKADSQQWLAHDRPITTEAESWVPEHPEVARRILNRLMLPGTGDRPPNVALIGSYGSGKTSICNLVKEAYERERAANPTWPSVLFCRFEAWEYMTREAAVRGLIETITETLLSRADLPELWRVPENYLAALGEGAGGWGKALSSVLDTRLSPKHVLARIGDVLLRLNLRLVLFVDDLDRIEDSAPDAQRAVTQALNQLQGTLGVQYVVAVGPTRMLAADSTAARPAYDLLKLTRFQEFVPRLNAEVAVRRVQETRDHALQGTGRYYPWVEPAKGEPTVIEYNEFFGRLLLPELTDACLELLDTPRVLKNALRETESAWWSGLNGEVNWYDLLLACALKTAEPALFEWVERNRETLLYGGSLVERIGQKEEARKGRAAQLKERVLGCMSRSTAERHKAVLDALKRLFPAFAENISDSSFGAAEAPLWEQRIACSPAHGKPYFERFLFGRVPENDIPDQPTLQYIRHIGNAPLDRPEFEGMFLATVKKQTGILNKLVQFGGLLSLDRALKIGRIIVEWVAVAAHAEEWPDTPDRYYSSMFGDVVLLVGRAGERERRVSDLHDLRSFKEKEQLVIEWAEQIVDDYAASNWLVARSLLQALSPSSGDAWVLSEDKVNSLGRRLAERLVDEYVLADGVLISALGDRLALNCEFLRLFGLHSQYNQYRTAFTRRVIDGADEDDSLRLRSALIATLVHAEPDPYTPSGHNYTVDRDQNDRRYDMSLVMPALRRWQDQPLLDRVVAAAFQKLLAEYGLVVDRENGTG